MASGSVDLEEGLQFKWGARGRPLLRRPLLRRPLLGSFEVKGTMQIEEVTSAKPWGRSLYEKGDLITNF